jgi:hypothetical protein
MLTQTDDGDTYVNLHTDKHRWKIRGQVRPGGRGVAVKMLRARPPLGGESEHAGLFGSVSVADG